MARARTPLLLLYAWLAVVGGCTGSDSHEPVARQLKLAYVMAPGGPADEAAHVFAKLVEEKTQGKIKVKIYPGAK